MDDERRPDSADPSPSDEVPSEASPLPVEASPLPVETVSTAEPAPEPAAEPAAPPPPSPLVDWRAPPAEDAEAWQYLRPPGWTGLDVVGVFGRTIDTFLGHWVTFVALAIPQAVVGLLPFLTIRSSSTIGIQPTDFLFLATIPIAIYVTTATVMAADDARAGRRVSAAAVLGPALGRALVALVSTIVVWILAIGLALFPLIAIGAAVGRGTTAAVAAALLGLVALVIGLYVGFRWSLSTMAIALDRAGPLSGLVRSWRITTGNLWRLGVLIVALAVMTLPWSIAGTFLVYGGSVAAGVLVAVVGTLAFGPLASILLSIAYGDITGRPRADVAVPVPAESWAAAGPVATGPADPTYGGETPIASSTALPEATLAYAPIEGTASPTLADPPEASEAFPAPVVASAAPPPARVSPTTRWVYVAGVFVLGVVLLIPGIAGAGKAFANIGLAGVPAADRGQIIAGTGRNPADPCTPLGRATTFSTADQIYLGGYFNRGLMPGQSATIHVLVNDEELVAAPINASGRIVGCYYELNALTGLAPAEYHILVDDSVGVLAEGRFTVK